MKTQFFSLLYLAASLFCSQKVEAYYPQEPESRQGDTQSTMMRDREPASATSDVGSSAAGPSVPTNPLPTANSGESGLGVKAELVKEPLASLADKNTGNSSLGDQFRCHTTDSDPLLDVCADAMPGSRYRLGNKVQGFRIYNGTDRDKRHWEFKFPNQARQDMMFQIDDYPYVADLMMIPRTHSPSVVRSEPNKMEVTLPNGEKITINRLTGKIVSGKLQEYGDKISTKLSYEGEGYLIQVQGKEGLNLNGESASNLQTATKATITRRGKSCSVDPSELWPNRKNTKEFPQFKFPKDEEFMNWLRNNSKCKGLAI
jgi:hypothetical protein